MRVIIAGSRTITSYKDIEDAVYFSNMHPTTIISGGAIGVDSLGEVFAAKNNLALEIYKAEWDRYGKAAGYRRNALMASKADALIAIWDGISKGTKHMIDIATAMKLQVYVYNIDMEILCK
jgi:hypothetical protein